MEMRLTLDDEVPVDKTVQGLGDTALEAMFIGYSVVAVARRQLKTIIKDLEVISNMDGANLVYNSIIQGNPAVVLIFADQAGSLTQSFALEVSCKPGEVLLDVAQGCSGMIEDTTRPFCQNGGCYNCEVEILEASELGMEENVVRACLFEVPEGVDELTLVQMTSEEAYGDML